jgi:putative inorganic carbon (hco3(-)) transporter
LLRSSSNRIVLVSTAIFLLLLCLAVYLEHLYVAVIPAALVIIYSAVFHQEKTLLLIAFFTPLSINLEEFTDGRMGLFLPTEPVLFGLMLLTILHQIRYEFIPKETWRHPIIITVLIYVLWLLISSITSSQPIVSFKFLLMKLWFIIPVLIFGVRVFLDKKNIPRFLWLFSIAMSAAIVYTLIRHAGYNFGEKEGHWVMEPLFKDHTIYGAIVAINFFLILALYFYKKHEPLTQLTLIFLFAVTVVGLYFSYTRGAWLSVVAAFIVWLCIHYKIKFKYLFTAGLAALLVIFLSWDKVQMELARNSAEHTTEKFDERIRSAANVTSDASNLERLNRWTAAWRMFQDRPIVGFGPATYAFEYAPYQDPEKLTIISTNFGDMGNAHSEYLGPLAETGLPGFLTVILFVTALFYCAITLYIRYPKTTDEDRSMRIILLFMILALVTYFVHGLLNNYLDTDKAAVPIYGITAAIIALEISLSRRKDMK